MASEPGGRDDWPKAVRIMVDRTVDGAVHTLRELYGTLTKREEKFVRLAVGAAVSGCCHQVLTISGTLMEDEASRKWLGLKLDAAALRIMSKFQEGGLN